MTAPSQPYPPLRRRGKTLTHEDQDILAETITSMQAPVRVETVSALIQAQVSTTGIDATDLAEALLRRLETREILVKDGASWSVPA